MSAITDAQAAMIQLHSLCLGFGKGSPPDLYSVMACVNELVKCHGDLSQESASKFGGMERKKIARKVSEAKHHRSLREAKKTMAEADKESFALSVAEFYEQVDAQEEYELYQAFLRSLDNAIRYGISVQSTIRGQEKNAQYGN